ncbi:MAG: LysM peptidoglycan-binding domain-containing protein [Elusimicrobiota bacterium]
MRYLLLGFLLVCCAGVRAQDDAAEVRKDTIQVETDHEVIKADNLWELAEHFYKNPWLWPRIYEANKDRIKDPHWIYPGQVFVIPGLGKTVTIVKEMPKPEPPPPPPPEPVEEEPPPIVYRPNKGSGAITLPDSLSERIPVGMTGQQPSMYRMRMAEDWEPDGRVLEYQDRESMVAAGDMIRVRIDGHVRKRQRYAVYRRGAPTEADTDKSAKYVQKVGLIEVVGRLSDGEYRAVILKSGGAIQLGDILKREQ